jgi:hypothetical protein
VLHNIVLIKKRNKVGHHFTDVWLGAELFNLSEFSMRLALSLAFEDSRRRLELHLRGGVRSRRFLLEEVISTHCELGTVSGAPGSRLLGCVGLGVRLYPLFG